MMVRRGMVALGLAVGVVGMASAAGGATAPIGPPVVAPAIQVTTDVNPARAYNQPQMLVDPRDPNSLAIVGANYNAGTCGAYTSLDGGRTWRQGKGVAKPPEFKTCVRSDFGPYLGAAYGVDGTIFMAAAADNLGGQQDVNNLFLARSTDLGDTWQTTVIHRGGTAVDFTQVDGTKITGGEHYSLVRMAVDPVNPQNVYVGARLGFADRTPPTGLFGTVVIRNVIAASTDGGKTFSDPVDIMANVPRSDIAGSYVPSITVGKDGTVYSVTRERTPPNDPAKPATATSPAGSPGSGGRVLLSVSTDHGKTWTTKPIDDSSVGCSGCFANPEARYDMKTGNLYVVMGQRETATSEQNIWLLRSTDGGKTWSPRIRVNHDTTVRDHTLPGISVAPDGRVDVAWADYRNDTQFNPAGTRSTQAYWDTYYSYSTDGGQTWADDVRISDRSMQKNEGYTFNDQYGLGGPMGVASTDTAALVSWADSRRGSVANPVEDFYFTTAAFAPSKGASTGTSSSHTARDIALGSVCTLLAVGLVLLVGSRVVGSRAQGTAGAKSRTPAPG